MSALDATLNYGFSSADFEDADYTELWVAGPLTEAAKLPIQATITVNDVSVATDDTSFDVAALTIKLYRFFQFTIGGVDVILTADAEIGATTLNCRALSGAIADASTAQVNPMVPVMSINTSNYQGTTNVQRNLRNFGSPQEEGADPTSNQDQLTCSGYLVTGDPGFELLQVARENLQRVYFEEIASNGDRKSGAAAVQSVNSNRQVGQKVTGGFTLSVDGTLTRTLAAA